MGIGKDRIGIGYGCLTVDNAETIGFCGSGSFHIRTPELDIGICPGEA